MSDGSKKDDRATFAWNIIEGGTGEGSGELDVDPSSSNAELMGIRNALENLPDVTAVHFLDNQGNVIVCNQTATSTARTRANWSNRPNWKAVREILIARKLETKYVTAWLAGHQNVEAIAPTATTEVEVEEDVSAVYNSKEIAAENDIADRKCDEAYLAEPRLPWMKNTPNGDDEDYVLIVNGVLQSGPISTAIDREWEQSTSKSLTKKGKQCLLWLEIEAGIRDSRHCAYLY